VGPFVSETDEAERAREREEIKRLLYVALTRARDRLYLATVLKDGQFTAGPGSLGSVLPDSMKPVFVAAAAAAADGDRVSWTGESGRVFEFRCCRNAQDPAAAPAPSDNPTTEEPVDDFTPVVDADSALRSGVPDRDSIADAGTARTAWLRRQISIHPDLARMKEGAERLHQVPFTMSDPDRPDRLLRGTIDCIVRRPDGSVTVVQFETGPPCEHDRRQLDLSVRAARELFAGRPVDGMLVYP
jgi:ATP-dependent exoDNAse (exonuclease V) beta subunit